MVDVTHVEGVEVDDEVTLVGVDGEHEIRIEDLAAWADTIPYEILCGLGRRVVRTYVDGRPPSRVRPAAASSAGTIAGTASPSAPLPPAPTPSGWPPDAPGLPPPEPPGVRE